MPERKEGEIRHAPKAYISAAHPDTQVHFAKAMGSFLTNQGDNPAELSYPVFYKIQVMELFTGPIMYQG